MYVIAEQSNPQSGLKNDISNHKKRGNLPLFLWFFNWYFYETAFSFLIVSYDSFSSA